MEDLEELSFTWTIIDGQLIALDSFLPVHPGGGLIRRAVGMDASELFHAHHTSQRAQAVLAKYLVGHVRSEVARPLRRELNRRMRGVSEQVAVAEVRPQAL